jgi:hypothetical protein
LITLVTSSTLISGTGVLLEEMGWPGISPAVR